MEPIHPPGRSRAAEPAVRRPTAARSVPLDLADRHTILAAAAAAPAPAEGLRLALPRPQPADAAYYERLETGARWLASRASSEPERREHLGMANRYARLRLDSAGGGRR